MIAIGLPETFVTVEATLLNILLNREDFDLLGFFTIFFEFNLVSDTDYYLKNSDQSIIYCLISGFGFSAVECFSVEELLQTHAIAALFSSAGHFLKRWFRSY